MKETLVDIPIGRIKERYSYFRIVNPISETVMFKSMERYGQVSPVIVEGCGVEGYELIDGFKRLRAVRKLECKSLLARVLPTSLHTSKAAILLLNWASQSINVMEEALVVHSLCREDGLTQVEIGTLLGRHKSWVCRRLSLLERLDDEVQENIRLGLVSAGIGRQLAKLPRGNQQRVLAAIQEHKFTCRETEQLVSELLNRPKRDHERILRGELLVNVPSKETVAIQDRHLGEATEAVKRKLLGFERSCLSMIAEINKDISHADQQDKPFLYSLIIQVRGAAERVIEEINTVLAAQKSSV